MAPEPTPVHRDLLILRNRVQRLIRLEEADSPRFLILREIALIQEAVARAAMRHTEYTEGAEITIDGDQGR